MGRSIPLATLNAEIRTVVSLGGTELEALWFDCPVCEPGHSHMIPFHDGDPVELRGLGKVWKLAAADAEGITLAPSYRSRCLHAFVRHGVLEVL